MESIQVKFKPHFRFWFWIKITSNSDIFGFLLKCMIGAGLDCYRFVFLHEWQQYQFFPFSHHIKTCHARILSIHDNKISVVCEFSIIYCLVQKTKLLDKPIKLTIDVMPSKLVFFYYNNDGKKMLMIQSIQSNRKYETFFLDCFP